MVRAGDSTKTVVLLEILAKEDSYGHTHAAESLYKVGTTGDGDLLRRAMEKGGSSALRLMAAGALAKAGNPAALAFIQKELASDEADTYRIAAWLIARLGSDTDIVQLRKNVERSPDALTKAYCEYALATLGDAAGRAALTQNLSNDDAALRVYAADFAADAWMTSAQAELEKLLDDKVLDVRIRAAHALLFMAQSPPAARAAESE
jgi:sialidase-1